MMALVNDIYVVGTINKEYRDLLIMLNPFYTHITEELYEIVGYDGVLNQQSWVKYDEAFCVDDTVEIVIQINGKVKDRIMVNKDLNQDEVLEVAKAPKIAEALDGKSIIKQIYVPNSWLIL